MGRVILCTGQTSRVPYHLKEPDINLYSIEELCYVLTQNAFLLERELLCKELVEWIEKECELPQLGRMLYPFLNRKSDMEPFVMTILQYVGLYDEEVLLQTAEAMKLGENLSVYEKRKKKIDYLAEQEKYETALAEYDRLLQDLPEGEKKMHADIWHNRGVVLAGLFAFSQAADSFRRAYELEPDEETWLQFLSAKRLELSEEDYISFVAGQEEKYRLSLELEKRVEDALQEYETDEKKQFVEQLKEWRGGEDANRYYAYTESISQQLKEIYRSHAAE